MQDLLTPPLAGPSGRTARATTVARDGQENVAAGAQNGQAGPGSNTAEPAQKEPEGPCPNRWVSWI